MFTPTGRPLPWRKASDFAANHCQKCAAGWTRTSKEGGTLTVCLLDREPVPTEMAGCDRFEPREEASS